MAACAGADTGACAGADTGERSRAGMIDCGMAAMIDSSRRFNGSLAKGFCDETSDSDMFLPSTTIAVAQCLQVMRTNLPRTFASLTEYCAEQELQTIIKPTSSLSLFCGGREPDPP